MSTTSAFQRQTGWNVQLICAKNNIFAGFYQYQDLLTIADVVHDLKLCFSRDNPADDDDSERWRRVLLPDVEADRPLLFLDESDKTTKIPTPPKTREPDTATLCTT